MNKFFKGRNEINKFTHEKKLSKEEYLVQIVGGYSVDELKISEIKDLIFELENMCNTIYAK